MYTGARIEELAMLKKSDVDLEQGVIRFRGTKTKAADRQVPMHPLLIPILSATMSDGRDEYVIGGLTIDARGERGKAIGKRFGRLKTDMGYGDEKVFHSIRKTVSTLFEQAEVLEGVAADILGHEKQTMTYGLYSGGSSLKQKREAIHKLKYPAV
jgi:integrase